MDLQLAWAFNNVSAFTFYTALLVPMRVGKMGVGYRIGAEQRLKSIYCIAICKLL
jgi:hypothetical protein